ncbi:hypothetical protein LCGC14_2955530 [marine sediment metagenome]|uniref:Uncharacterized protein n=1 Tax=marine sediment metagenome TaxID=412755 RepID=A0A0F9A553_9ZZZZ
MYSVDIRKVIVVALIVAAASGLAYLFTVEEILGKGLEPTERVRQLERVVRDVREID